MPREMSYNATEFLNILMDGTSSEDNAFRHVNAYPLGERNIENGPVAGVDYLIDATKYVDPEKPEDVPLKDKIFLMYQKGYNGFGMARKASFEELVAAQQPQEKPFKEEPEPELHGFAWLRHKLSFLFGEPQAIKEHQRRKDVARAKKIEMINEKYGCTFPYEKGLADEATARSYITTGSRQPAAKKQKTAKKVNDVKASKKNEIGRGKEGRDRLERKQAAKLIELLFNGKVKTEVVNALKGALLDETEKKDDQKSITNYILALQKNKDVQALTGMMKKFEELDSKTLAASKRRINSSDILRLADPDSVGEDNPFYEGWYAFINQDFADTKAGRREWVNENLQVGVDLQKDFGF